MFHHYLVKSENQSVQKGPEKNIDSIGPLLQLFLSFADSKMSIDSQVALYRFYRFYIYIMSLYDTL